jgi:hypothetical protein
LVQINFFWYNIGQLEICPELTPHHLPMTFFPLNEYETT